MLKTSLIILYAVPLCLALFWIYKYYALASVNSYYAVNVKELDSKLTSFNDVVSKLRPEADKIEASEQLFDDYRKVAAVARTSWTTLFSRLEKLAPAEMRFKSISIRPDTLVQVSIEGETIDIAHLTGFLQNLFVEKVFSSPDLKSHRRNMSDGVEVIDFSLKVDYSGEKGELP